MPPKILSPPSRPATLPSVLEFLRWPELDIFGFLIPWDMMIMALGVVTAWVVARALEMLGLTRHVWHLPLFFVALAVFCIALWGLLFTP